MADAARTRTQSFSVALSPDMVEQIDGQIADSGLSRSAWIRKAVEFQLRIGKLRQHLQQRNDLTASELTDYLRVLDGGMPAVKRNPFKNESIPDVMWLKGWNDAEMLDSSEYPNDKTYMSGWQARKDKMELKAGETNER